MRPSAMTPNVGGSDGAPCGGRAAQRAWILLVDGHVHSHECFTWKTFLDAAAASFARARAALALNHQSPGCPMFTESAGMNQFRKVAEHPDGARLPSTDGAGTSGTALAAATREHRQQTGRAGAAARGAMNGMLNPPQTFGWGGEQCHHR